MKESKFIKKLKVSYEKTGVELIDINITSSDKVYEFLKQLYPVDISHKECFICLYLSHSHKIIGYDIMSIGGVASCIVPIEEILKNALLCNAKAIILTHNHPSGQLIASDQDRKVTDDIVKASKLFNINVLDHIIVTEDGYKSIL